MTNRLQPRIWTMAAIVLGVVLISGCTAMGDVAETGPNRADRVVSRRQTGGEPEFGVLPVDSVLTLTRVAGGFGAAKRMSVQPDGTIMVVDAEAAVVRRITALGERESIGGPGAVPGAFFQPADVDATSGLFILVADAGNGRIQRFSARGALVEVLPIPSGNGAAGRAPTPVFRPGAAGDAASDGRPEAVVLSGNDDVYVLEGNAGVVLRTDRQRREWSVIGGVQAGEGRLMVAVDLSYWDSGLYVADAQGAMIRVYDAFGSHVRNLAPGRLTGIVAVHASGDGILALAGHSLILFDGRGFLQHRFGFAFEGGEATARPVPIAVDVFRTRDTLYILTEHWLYRAR